MISQKLLKKIENVIIEKHEPEKVILFGSYANGHPDKDSDLDLLIVKNSKLPRYKRAIEIRKSLWGITDIPKDILVYTQREINDWAGVRQAFITDVVNNGKILYENKRRLNR